MTQVKTVYARVAVILLALNFCFTGYIVKQVMQIQSESIAAPKVTTKKMTPAVQAVPDVESLPRDVKEDN